MSNLSHLQRLEAESIHIMREVVAECENPVFLYSIGKDSAVMLHSRLRAGMTLVQIVAMTRSLGRKVAAAPETWAWSDAGDATVTLVLVGGKLRDWALSRRESDVQAD